MDLSHLQKSGGCMHKYAVTVILLALCAMPIPGMSQATEQPPATERETPAAPPAKRPRMPAVITFESSVGTVHFPHRVHQKMGCQKCHHQIHAKDLNTPHEAYLTYSWVNCHDCHDESQNDSSYYGCAKCHHSNLQNIADETLNAKVVVHKSCWKCHLSGTGAVASERCVFCHVREEEPLATADGKTTESPPGTAGPTADAGIK